MAPTAIERDALEQAKRDMSTWLSDIDRKTDADYARCPAGIGKLESTAIRWMVEDRLRRFDRALLNGGDPDAVSVISHPDDDEEPKTVKEAVMELVHKHGSTVVICAAAVAIAYLVTGHQLQEIRPVLDWVKQF